MLVVERLGKTQQERLQKRHLLETTSEAFLVAGNSDLIERMLTALAQMPEAALSSLTHLLTDQAARADIDRLISAFVPEDAAQFQQDRQAQILSNTRLRRQFLTENETLTAAQLAEGALSKSANRSALAWQWRSKGRIFGVPLRGERRYPAFQLDPATGQPRPLIREILEILGRRLGDWGTALWFAAPNAWLGGGRPVDRLDDPDALFEAARAAVTQPDF
jgi:hypothetical protein